MSTRTYLSRIIGAAQCLLGAVALILAYATYAIAAFQEALSIDGEEIALFMFAFLVLGVFSVTSGVILLRVNQT